MDSLEESRLVYLLYVGFGSCVWDCFSMPNHRDVPGLQDGLNGDTAHFSNERGSAKDLNRFDIQTICLNVSK